MIASRYDAGAWEASVCVVSRAGHRIPAVNDGRLAAADVNVGGAFTVVEAVPTGPDGFLPSPHFWHVSFFVFPFAFQGIPSRKPLCFLAPFPNWIMFPEGTTYTMLQTTCLILQIFSELRGTDSQFRWVVGLNV